MRCPRRDVLVRATQLGALIALMAPVGAAQIVEVQGGGSSYYDGYGINANVWGGGYDGWLGAGYQKAWRFGGFARKQLAGRDTIRAGNDVIVLRFPTDIFGSGQNLLVQGATYQATRGRYGTSAFAGASATGLGVPLFSARRADKPFGSLTVTDSVSPTVRLRGQMIAASRMTFAASGEWTTPQLAKVAATTGVGANKPFAAVSGTLSRDLFDARVSWMRAAPGYRRVDLPVPVQTRLDGLGAEFVVRPLEWLAFVASRQTFILDSAVPVQDRSTGTSAVASAQFGRAHAAVGLYRSDMRAGTNRSGYLAGGMPFGDAFALDAYVLAAGLGDSVTRVTPVVSLHERVRSNLALDQMITISGRQSAVSLGGTYQGSLFDIGIGYQIVHVPFERSDPFKRSLTLTLRLSFGDARANVGTTVLPTGEVQYDASAATFLYLGAANGLQPTVVRSQFDHYVVQGTVQDEDGVAIGGAALRIGEDIVFTDSRGSFFMRTSRRCPVAFSVVFEEFLVRGTFVVVSAPATVTPVADALAKPVTVVLRRDR